MDFSTWYTSFSESVGGYLPGILGALAILLVGWIVALIGRALVRRALGALRLNEKLSTQVQAKFDLERTVASIVFWIIFLFALIAMFNVLRIDSVSGPLSALAASVMLYLPRILLAAALILVAWLLATIVRTVVDKALAATRLDDSLSKAAGVRPISESAGQVVYWLVILLFLPAIVGALQIEGLMVPLMEMSRKLLSALPNIIAALAIGGIGWLIASVLRGLVTSLLATSGVDRFSESREGSRGVQISQLGGTLVFILVIVPTLIAALDALKIEVISDPARDMLRMFMTAIPNILAAAAILAIAWFIGRFASGLVARLLASLGFDRLPERLGLPQAFPAVSAAPPDAARVEGSVPDAYGTPSALVGGIAFFFVMLFATVEAAHRLGFTGVRDLLETFIEFGADILVGLVILAVGQWLANLAATAIRRTGRSYSELMSTIARVAILGLVIAMGLRAMGIADQIVNLAFGLVLGAVAVAFAIAFGVGGRESAGRLTRHWVDRYLEQRGGSDSRK